MSPTGTIFVFALTASVLCGTEVIQGAELHANPYQRILERNVFRLGSPPPPAPAADTKPPLPKIFLTGIATIPAKRALLKIPAQPGGKGAPQTTEAFFNLAEGQRDRDMEVLEIDPKAGMVKVNYSGTVMRLTFAENGVKELGFSADGAGPFRQRGGLTGPPGPGGAWPAQPDVNRPQAPNLPMGFPGPNPRFHGQKALGRNSPPITADEQSVLIELQRQLKPDAPESALLPPTGLQ